MNSISQFLQNSHYFFFNSLIKLLGGIKHARRSYALAEKLGLLRTRYGYIGSGWSKDVYLQTIKSLLPHISADDAESLVEAYWINHQKRFVELFLVQELTPDNLGALVEFEGLEHLDAALEEGRGVILPVPHIGNERLHHIVLAVKGYPMSVISSKYSDHGSYARKIKIEASRRFHDVGYPGNAIWLLRAVKNNRVLQVASTAEAGSQGALINFLGQEVLLPAGWARLALKTEAPVLPSVLLRQDNGIHRLTIYPEFKVIRTNSRVRDLQENVQNYMNIIAEIYQNYPHLVDWMTMTVRLNETRQAKMDADHAAVI